MKNQMRLKEFYDNTQEGITIIDADSLRFIDCNDNALSLLQFSMDEIMDQGPVTISPEYQPCGERSEEKARKLIESTLKGEKPVFDWLVKTGSGRMSVFEVRLTLLPDKRGVRRIYASFVDVMERKQYEEMILLQNKKLVEIGFLQSHQVRQPIANILGLVNLFNFKDLNDPLNSVLLLKVRDVVKSFDDVIKAIVDQTNRIEELVFKCKHEASNEKCNPIAGCSSISACFKEKAKSTWIRDETSRRNPGNMKLPSTKGVL